MKKTDAPPPTRRKARPPTEERSAPAPGPARDLTGALGDTADEVIHAVTSRNRRVRGFFIGVALDDGTIATVWREDDALPLLLAGASQLEHRMNAALDDRSEPGAVLGKIEGAGEKPNR